MCGDAELKQHNTLRQERSSDISDKKDDRKRSEFHVKCVFFLYRIEKKAKIKWIERRNSENEEENND